MIGNIAMEITIHKRFRYVLFTGSPSWLRINRGKNFNPMQDMVEITEEEAFVEMI